MTEATRSVDIEEKEESLVQRWKEERSEDDDDDDDAKRCKNTKDEGEKAKLTRGPSGKAAARA